MFITSFASAGKDIVLGAGDIEEANAAKNQINMTLKNRRFLSSQYFEILPSGIKVEKKTFFDSSEFDISFESIYNKKKVQTAINHNVLFLSFFSGFVAVCLFFLGWDFKRWFIPTAIALLFFLLAVYTKRRMITISAFDGNDIVLFFRKDNRKEIIDFADKIIAHSNNFLLRKYGKIDRAMPAEPQLNNLIFLRDREIINETEFESLKNQLFGRDSKSNLGFQ